MKIFILLIITTWSFGGGCGNLHPVTKEVVSSPEAAAIRIYEIEQSEFGPEPDRHEYELYEVNFKEKTVKAIDIPIIKFLPKTMNDCPITINTGPVLDLTAK